MMTLKEVFDKNPSGREALFHRLKGSVSRKEIGEFLRNDEANSVFKKLSKQPKLAPIMVFEPFQLWELDLIDFSTKPDGTFRYVMVVVDDFTKYVWATPMHSKAAYEVGPVLKEIFKDGLRLGGGLPKAIMSDSEAALGSEDLRLMFRADGVQWINRGKLHAPTAERMILTIKTKLEKLYVINDTNQWVKFIPSIVKSINSSVHSVTGFTPMDAWKHVDGVRWNLQAHYNKIFENLPTEKVAVGDEVRIAMRNFMQKGTAPKWSVKTFTVAKKSGNKIILNDGEVVHSNEIVRVHRGKG